VAVVDTHRALVPVLVASLATPSTDTVTDEAESTAVRAGTAVGAWEVVFLAVISIHASSETITGPALVAETLPCSWLVLAASMFNTASVNFWPLSAFVDVKFAGLAFPSESTEALESTGTFTVVSASGTIEARALEGDHLLAIVVNFFETDAAVIDIGATSEGILVGVPLSRVKVLVQAITFPEFSALASEGTLSVGTLSAVIPITGGETLGTLINVFFAEETGPALRREGGGAVAGERVVQPEFFPGVGASSAILARVGGAVVDVDTAIINVIILTSQPTVVVRGGNKDRTVGNVVLVEGVAISLETLLALAGVLSNGISAVSVLVAHVVGWVSLLSALVDLGLAVTAGVSEWADAGVLVDTIDTPTTVEARETNAVVATEDNVTLSFPDTGSLSGLRSPLSVHTTALSISRGSHSADTISASTVTLAVRTRWEVVSCVSSTVDNTVDVSLSSEGKHSSSQGNRDKSSSNKDSESLLV
jgi:hypothetical protein